MKKMFLIKLLILIGTSQGFSSLLIYSYEKNDALLPSPTVNMDEKKEAQVELKARVIQGKVYVSLVMLNEEKASVYSLVREFKDGSFESVDIRYGVKNVINTPLLYSMVDKEVPHLDFTYALYRISDETTLIQKWHYCADEKELCPIENEDLAISK